MCVDGAKVTEDDSDVETTSSECVLPLDQAWDTYQVGLTDDVQQSIKE